MMQVNHYELYPHHQLFFDRYFTVRSLQP